MNYDHVRNLIARQRSIEARRPEKHEDPGFGDVAVAVVCMPVAAWAAIDTIVRLFA